MTFTRIALAATLAAAAAAPALAQTTATLDIPVIRAEGGGRARVLRAPPGTSRQRPMQRLRVTPLVGPLLRARLAQLLSADTVVADTWSLTGHNNGLFLGLMLHDPRSIRAGFPVRLDTTGLVFVIAESSLDVTAYFYVRCELVQNRHVQYFVHQPPAAPEWVDVFGHVVEFVLEVPPGKGNIGQIRGRQEFELERCVANVLH